MNKINTKLKTLAVHGFSTVEKKIAPGKIELSEPPFKLRPVRNRSIIDIPVLCAVMQKIMPGNSILYNPDAIIINGTVLKIAEGIAIAGKTKFRFQDMRDLLVTLQKERILICTMLDIRCIKDRYYKIISENELF